MEDDPTAIINGEFAIIEDFPFYALLMYAPDNVVQCGGCIVSDKMILTAAHCVDGEDKDDLLVYTGVSSLRDVQEKSPIKIQKVIMHPDYNKRIPGYHDLAVLKLKSKIKLGDDAQIISLATQNPVVGDKTLVVGLGAVYCKPGTQDCMDADHLKAATMTIKRIGAGDSIKSRGENSNVCYVRCQNLMEQDLYLFCLQGDSGGPMIYEGGVVGVASSVDHAGCMTGGNTYTNVYLNADWIKKNAKIH